jgi:hypothetical protein
MSTEASGDQEGDRAAPRAKPGKRKQRAWLAGGLAVLAVGFATFGVRAYVVRHAAPAARPPVSATPLSALICPKTVPVDKRTNPWVPAKPQGLDGAARLAPLREPARAIVCAYIRSPTTTVKSGSVLLTGDLSGVMNDLAWIPPARPLTARPCTANLLLTDARLLPDRAQLLRFDGMGGCAEQSLRGLVQRRVHQYRESVRPRLGLVQGTSLANPGSNDACKPSGFGRLGQQDRMVPDHPVSVSVCEVSAADGGKATPRTETTGVGSLASAVGALRASAWHYQCKPDGQPLTDYNLLFGYAEGPPRSSPSSPTVHRQSTTAVCRPTTQQPSCPSSRNFSANANQRAAHLAVGQNLSV